MVPNWYALCRVNVNWCIDFVSSCICIACVVVVVLCDTMLKRGIDHSSAAWMDEWMDGWDSESRELATMRWMMMKMLFFWKYSNSTWSVGDLWLIHTARDWDRDREMMGFCIMLYTVHTTLGQGQGQGQVTIVFYCTHPGPGPCPVPGPVQCEWAIRL